MKNWLNLPKPQINQYSLQNLFKFQKKIKHWNSVRGKILNKLLKKAHLLLFACQGNRNPRDAGGVYFVLFVCVSVWVFVRLTQQKNDLKYDTHSARVYLATKNCSVTWIFLQISSIDFFLYFTFFLILDSYLAFHRPTCWSYTNFLIF